MDRDGEVDVQLDVLTEGYVGRLAVIEGPTGRKRRSVEERARIAAESLMPGMRVAEVARRHGATRWQVYDWRRQLRNLGLTLPESIATTPAFAALVVEEPPGRARQAHSLVDIVMDDAGLQVTFVKCAAPDLQKLDIKA